MDLWGLDAVIAGSQKTLMLPPGLGFVAFSERAWEAAARATMPKFYFDLTKARNSLEKGGETPYTPNTSLFVALEVALNMIWEEGLEQRWERHHRLALAARAGMKALKLSLFAAPNVLSDTITSVTSPVDSGELTKRVREEHKIIIAGGQDELKGRIFRIGHMGTCQLEQVLQTVEAIAAVLNGMGYECDGAAAVEAAGEAY
jgi:aspartate aminotransferase-like enzyme